MVNTGHEHQPHILRPHLDEWCGGTVPPTIVTGFSSELEARVDVYDESTDIHDGMIHAPEATERFMMFSDQLDTDRVRLLSEKALNHLIIKEG
jgi:hypothetical protein